MSLGFTREQAIKALKATVSVIEFSHETISYCFTSVFTNNSSYMYMYIVFNIIIIVLRMAVWRELLIGCLVT